MFIRGQGNNENPATCLKDYEAYSAMDDGWSAVHWFYEADFCFWCDVQAQCMTLGPEHTEGEVLAVLGEGFVTDMAPE
ncbi:MAG: hypothetical protein DRO89_05990 [Candidatus Altiarchaeales archaeon]|nr:MAG: hypothetical protein DRO89_05990 [Candidatus Altiarchaeales archaeon]